MLRIIGGLYRSRKLLQPPMAITRPTKDRVREAIFSAIGNKVVDANILDLFAGSGAYGLEAISRGAKFVHFNDHHPEAVKTIEANVNSLKIDQVKITRLDAFELIQSDTFNKSHFHILFLDPPYAYSQLEELIQKLFESHLLIKGSIIVLENESAHHHLNQDKWNVKSYNYGRTYVHIGSIKK